MDLNHLHLSSPDVEASVAFYKENFDFHKAQKLEGGSYFLYNRDGFMIAIGKDKQAQPGDKIPMPDWFHYGFRLDSIEAVEELYVKMRTTGHVIREALTKYEDFVFFRCEDPAGFLLEVYWAPGPLKLKA